MEQAIRNGGAPPERGAFDTPLKMTALIYLREALLKEEYEKCPVIVEFAGSFGARETEIKDILENPRRPLFMRTPLKSGGRPFGTRKTRLN